LVINFEYFQEILSEKIRAIRIQCFAESKTSVPTNKVGKQIC
jgi:hypothetical protein